MEQRIALGAILAFVIHGAAVAQGAPTAPGKTRAEVRAELEQARRDGWLPYKRYDYPPSRETVRRNRERYAITHPSPATIGNAHADSR
nr:DUF4148 domain-containing protein [Paraburkholderia mimosarum]